MTPQYYLAELATITETEVLVSGKDFEAALAELVPSVSQVEMDHYALVQQRFSGVTMNSLEPTNVQKIRYSEGLLNLLGGNETSVGDIITIDPKESSKERNIDKKVKEIGKGKSKEREIDLNRIS